MRIVGFCQALPFLMLSGDQFVVLAHAWMLSHASPLQETNASGDTLRAHALTDFGPSTSLADGSASPELPSYPPSSQDPPQSSDASAIDSETEAAVQENSAGAAVAAGAAAEACRLQVLCVPCAPPGCLLPALRAGADLGLRLPALRAGADLGLRVQSSLEPTRCGAGLPKPAGGRC